MKNKVLRLAIVAVLVVAMVLSMAACNDPKPDVTPTTPVVTPTPTKTPDVTPVITPKPTPVVPSAADDTALAKATYGIELKGEDFTYGIIVDPDDATKKYSEVTVAFNKDLMQNYETFIESAIKWSVEYEGEGAAAVVKAGYASTIVAGVPTLTFTETAPAGVYTVHVSVEVEDKGFNFGRFGAIKADKVTYELTKVITIKKADLTVKVPSYVAPVEVNATKAPAAQVFEKVEAGALLTALETAYGNTGYDFYLRAASMIDTTKVGSYELVLTAHPKAKTATEDNIVAFAEIPAINHNVTFETGKQYFVDKYDWNAIRDVATSILELKIDADANLDINKVKLARARYDALTDAQKAFFATGLVATAPTALTYTTQTTVGGFTCGTTAAVGTDLVTSVTTISGKIIYALLTAAETTLKDAAVLAAWEKAVKDAKFDEYNATFNIENATHVASFNAVKAYYDALSAADQNAVKTNKNEGKAKAYYAAYERVSGLFGVKAVKEVQTLIAAAAAAYNRAVENSPVLEGAADTRVFKAIYIDALKTTADGDFKIGDNAYNGVVYYLNNAEVVAVTNQANAAFEKLSTDQKKALKTEVLADADTDKIKLYFDVDARNYDTLLGALVTMNKVVGYMEQVVSHTHIEDLQHQDGKTPAYQALNRIVYGKVGKDSANYLTIENNKRNTFNAVSDIIRAYNEDSASLDAVVAEYKAMIDYVLAGEAYKAEQIAALNALIATEFVSANHTDSEIAIATATSNQVLAGIVNGIRMEQNPAFKTRKGLTATDVTDPATGVVGNGKTVQTILNGNVESYEDAKAAFEGLYNLDKAMTIFLKNYTNTVVTTLTTDTKTVKEMLFTKLVVTFAEPEL